MKYKIVEIPFELNFSEMSKAQHEQYLSWLLSVTDARIQALADAVSSCSSFSDWRPDYSPRALSELGKWFEGCISTRVRSEDEKKALASSGLRLAGPPDWELSDETASIAFDVGIYFSKMFLQRHAGVKWAVDWSRKDSVDYGQPVLVGFNRVSLNPITLVLNLAYGLARGSKSGAALLRFYETWSRLLPN